MDTLMVHTQETLRITVLDTFGDARPTRRNKNGMLLVFSVRAPICERRSREPSERGEDGKTNEVNGLHSFRGHVAEVASSCSRAAVADIGCLVEYSRDPALEVLYFVLPQKQITFIRDAPSSKTRSISDVVSVARAGWSHLKHHLAYCQSTESFSSATLTVLGCRVESSPSDVEDLCLSTWVLRPRSRALPCVTIIAAYSMAGKGLTRNAQYLVQNPAKLPGGERRGMRRSAKYTRRVKHEPHSDSVPRST